MFEGARGQWACKAHRSIFVQYSVLAAKQAGNKRGDDASPRGAVLDG